MKLRGTLFSATITAAALVTQAPSARADGAYSVSREVSNIPPTSLVAGPTGYLDAELDAPWGLAKSHDPCDLFTSLACHAETQAQLEPREVLWAANHDSRVLTVYDDQGVALTSGGEALTVAMVGAPTGLVYNPGCKPTVKASGDTVRYTTRCDASSTAPTGDFDVSVGGAFAPSFLLVAARDGKIYGWNPAIDAANADVVRDDSAAGADYLGLALDPTGSAVYLADFGNGRVVAYDRGWSPITFRDDGGVAHLWLDDPSIPQGFAPSNVAFVNGRLLVTYGKQGPVGAAHEAVGPTYPGALYSGPHGYVVAFTLHADGTHEIRHLDAPDHALDAPWAIVLSPWGFGAPEPLLYVGNFGDGTIATFDQITLEYRGHVGDSAAVRLPGLRGLQFKTTESPGDGLNGELDRLFYNASLRYDAGPGPDAWSVFGFIASGGTR